MQQPLEMKLRMSFFTPSLFIGAERFPFLGRHRTVVGHGRQNDGAIVQSRNSRQQVGNGRGRRRDTRRDRETLRSSFGPSSRQCVQQSAAPFCETNDGFLGQNGWPVIEYRREAFNLTLPMGGQLDRVRDRFLQSLGRDFLHRQLVHRPCQLGGKAHCLSGAFTFRAKQPR